jgi:hypothetical protein
MFCSPSPEIVSHHFFIRKHFLSLPAKSNHCFSFFKHIFFNGVPYNFGLRSYPLNLPSNFGEGTSRESTVFSGSKSN